MKKIKVNLSQHPHEVRIGNGIFLKNFELSSLKKMKIEKAFVIADESLKSQTKRVVEGIKKLGCQVHVLTAPAQESMKDFHEIYPYYGKLLELGADRSSVLFAVGGGVIGDAAGFLAGTYLRGIRWVGIPTTLLAQVDSSVGGKTGINHARGKNLIGVFHQPVQVLCDVSFLRTLPKRDLISGFGEMVKYGIVFDPKLYRKLIQGWKQVFDLDPLFLEKTVHQCLEWKVKTFTQDEFDTKGVREVLNFGHTFGHALEAELGYGSLRHGEAILWGMRAALYLSTLCGHLRRELQEKLDRDLASLPLPSLPDQLKASAIQERLKWDKKSKNGRLRFVLLKDLGHPVLDPNVPPFAIIQTIEWLLSQGVKQPSKKRVS